LNKTSQGVVSKLRHALGGGVEEFVTVQTQEISFSGKFETSGGGSFLRDVICEQLPKHSFILFECRLKICI